MIAQAACDATDGALKEFSLDEGDWYELRVASWLHDCGKLATPDYLLDKATKLHLLNDGIETVKARFATLIAQTESEYLKIMLLEPTQQDNWQQQLANQLAFLKEECTFIETANKGGEFMSAEAKQRVKDIGQRSYIDHQGQLQRLLTDKETDFLCIERGTITFDERQKINDHMKVTIQMLESLPFPKNLKRVPEYAGGHHEKMDGTGFPKGLKREQMSWPARMMAIADIFEALTASERPYKPAMKISQALSIMQRMRDQNHIDPDLYQLFLQARVWHQYASRFLKPEQLDVDSFEAYL